MFFPEFLYQLSARDQQVTWLDPVAVQIDNAAAAAIVSADFVVPDGMVFLCKNAFLLGFSAGVQTVTQIQLQLVGRAGSPQLDVNRTIVAAPAVQVPLNLNSIEILCPPLWRLRSTITFNGAAAGNTARIVPLGMLIPVANIQRL